tara:strand:+ start:25509 stop:25757 length:249 start_codon:yes stop_codon:yes gene_type:complete
LIGLSGVLYPKTIHVDQGSDFLSRALELQAYQKSVALDFSPAGKTTDNAFTNRRNSTLAVVPKAIRLIPDTNPAQKSIVCAK